MEKQVYQLISVISPQRIILGLCTGFTKGQLAYDSLQEKLELEWQLRICNPTSSGKIKFTNGDHVLVRSESTDGARRGVVLEKLPLEDDYIYKVFLYDLGKIEDVVGSQVLSCKREDLGKALPPRAMMVDIIGIIPAKLVKNSQIFRRIEEEGAAGPIFIQGSHWSKKSFLKVKEWCEENSRGLYVDASVKKDKCIVVGDIYKKVKNAEGESMFESLREWMLGNNLALHSDSMVDSQLNAAAPLDFDQLVDKEKGYSASEKSKQKRNLEGMELNCNTETKLESASNNSLKQKKVFSGSSSTESSISESSSQSKSVVKYRAREYQIHFDTPGRILIRGAFSRKPYERMEQLALPEPLVNGLHVNGAEDLSELQKAACPNFMMGSDLIVISADAGSQYGRNARFLSFAVPILHLMYVSNLGKSLHDVEACSPEAVIIVNSFNVGQAFESFLESLLSYSQHVPLRVKFLTKDISMEAYAKNPDKYTMKILPPGINILIVTINYFQKMLESSAGPRLFEQLRFIVFEELEAYFTKIKEELIATIELIRVNAKHRINSAPLQMAFGGSKWYPEIEDLYRCLVQERAPVVVIGALNQAIRYANVNWNVHNVEVGEGGREKEHDAKFRMLYELLRKELSYDHRIVVTCSSPSVAEDVYKHIIGKKDIPAQYASSKLDHDTLTFAMTQWSDRQVHVVVVSDEMIRRFEIFDATCIISFDSPDKCEYKTNTAADRFSFIWHNIRNIDDDLNPHKIKPDSVSSDFRYPANLVIHFLMTGGEHNFYSMYKFSKTLDSVYLAPELKELVKMIETQGCSNRSLCMGTKMFGFCNYSDPALCPGNHEFTEKDLKAEPIAPVDGEIEICIVKCFNPSYYRVQMIRHYVFVDGKRKCAKSYDAELRRRSKILDKFFALPTSKEGEPTSENNRIPLLLSSLTKGYWCAVQDPETGSFLRGRVESVVQRDLLDVPISARVNCVDLGRAVNPEVQKIYELPSEFQDWPPLVVNLVLGNLKPTQGEMEYRRYDEQKAKRYTSDKIYNAKICLSVGDTVWVNPMVEYHVDPDTKLPVKGISVRKEFLEFGVADSNKEHLDNLFGLVRKHGELYQGHCALEREMSVKATKFERCQDEIEMARQEFHQLGDGFRWAFMPQACENMSPSNVEPTRVLTIYGKSPHVFFGVHEKFQDQVRELENELHEYIEKYINEKQKQMKGINFQEAFSKAYEPETIVAAKERKDGLWMRAMIVSSQKKTDGEVGATKVVFTVFFVDYGDLGHDMEVHELFPIPRKFVSRLPFQAIAFKLNYIQPKSGSSFWETKEKNAFLDVILEDSLSWDLDVLAMGEAEVEVQTPETIPCRYYNAVAFKENDELNALLVQRGIASWKPGGEDLVERMKDKLLEFYQGIVDRGLGFQNSNSEDEEDLFGFCPDGFADNVLTSMGLNGYRGRNEYSASIPNMHTSQNPETDFENVDNKSAEGSEAPLGTQEADGLERRENVEASLECNSTTLSSLEFTTVRGNQGAVNQSGAKPPRTSLVPPPSGTTFDLLRPPVSWRQTDRLLVLTVNLADIKLTDEWGVLATDERTVYFETKQRPTNYGFSMPVFGKLKSQFESLLTGMYLEIKFTKKLASVKWPRILQKKDESYSWLKEQVADVSDDE